jgi:hypothetical protein
LIDRWEGYLAESIVQIMPVYPGYEGDYSDDELEERWQTHLKREADFHGHGTEDDSDDYDR